VHLQDFCGTIQDIDFSKMCFIYFDHLFKALGLLHQEFMLIYDIYFNLIEQQVSGFFLYLSELIYLFQKGI
jgi:hypothetical protein